jgi:hypothetical protein
MSKGGGSSVPANTSSTVTNRIDLPDWVNTLGQQNVATAQGLAAQPYTPYPGQTVAPITPLQQQGYDVAAGQLNATQPVFQRALGQVEDLPGSTRSLLNPYLGDVENAAVSNIQRQGDISRMNLQSGAAGQGAFGGTRYGVEEGLLNSETQRNIGQTVAQIESQGWNTAMSSALQQAGSEAALATGGQQAALTGAQAAISAGGAQQTQQQAELTDALQRWQQAQQYPYQQLGIMQGALAGTPYGTTTNSTQPYSQNPTASTLGNIAAGVGLLGAGSNLFSKGGLFGSAGPVAGLFSEGGLFGPAAGTAALNALGPSGAEAMLGLPAAGSAAAMAGLSGSAGSAALAGLGADAGSYGLLDAAAALAL